VQASPIIKGVEVFLRILLNYHYSVFYALKVSYALAEREIIAMLRYFNMSCQTDRLPSVG